jgi:hypothetical protein
MTRLNCDCSSCLYVLMETLEWAAAKTDFLHWYFFFGLWRNLMKNSTHLSLSLSLYIYIYIYIGKSIDQKNYIILQLAISTTHNRNSRVDFRLKICKQISQKVMADIDTTFGCHSKTSVGLTMVEILDSWVDMWISAQHVYLVFSLMIETDQPFKLSSPSLVKLCV